MPASQRLAGPPISVRIRSPTENITSFSKPILITLTEGLRGKNLENASCTFWDKEEKTWSTKGLESRISNDGELICSTMHLSLFGAVFQELQLLEALLCENI